MSTLVYEDFEIKIAPPTDGVFPVTIDSAAGQGRTSFKVPFSVAELAERLEKLVDEGTGAQELGASLFEALLTGIADDLYNQSLGRLSGRAELGLRIKLHIDPTDPQSAALGALPWEYMYSAHEFLNLHRHTPIVRYLDVQRTISLAPLKLPLRILVVMSSPTNYPQLDLAKERQLLEQELGGRDDIELVFLKDKHEHATISALQDELTEGEFHALHYMGHGGINPNNGRGILLLENDAGDADRCDGEDLGMLLSDAGTIRLVFLNACETAKLEEGSVSDPFGSVANALVLKGLLAVIAMQFPITDAAAILFAQKVYPLLARGNSIDYAVAEGRKAVRLGLKSMEWGTPVLYMRARDGRLFALEQAEVADDVAAKARLALDTRAHLRDGKYRIIKQLARRGFMNIYQARDTEHRRYVLIRELVLAGSVATDTLARLTEGLKELERVKNPHIIETYEIFAERDKIYVAAEFMTGGTLEDRLGQYAAINLWEGLQTVDETCAALKFIHQNGEVHGRLKPANIMFTADGAVKLENVSLFNLVEDVIKESMPIKMEHPAPRAPYTPPEQTTARSNDPRVDIYALGAIMYRVTTGEFYKDRPLRELQPDVPTWLADPVMKCLAQEPGERYPSVAELQYALIYGDRSPDKYANEQMGEWANGRVDEAGGAVVAGAKPAPMRRMPTETTPVAAGFTPALPANAWIWVIIGSWFTLLAVFVRELLRRRKENAD